VSLIFELSQFALPSQSSNRHRQRRHSTAHPATPLRTSPVSTSRNAGLHLLSKHLSQNEMVQPFPRLSERRYRTEKSFRPPWVCAYACPPQRKRARRDTSPSRLSLTLPHRAYRQRSL